MKHTAHSALLSILLGFAGAAQAAPAAKAPASPPSPPPTLQSASDDVREVARWVLASGDNAGMPFLLVDKPNAQVYLFDARGTLRATAPALLGLARGDRLLAPNDATLAQIRPFERVTPAGRYVSRLARDSEGKELLVMDYEAAISLHPVIKGTPEERRAERLRSQTAQDNRISYGCINVPKPFYADFVRKTFANTGGVVYVLPEMGSAHALFGMPPAPTMAARTTAVVQHASAP